MVHAYILSTKNTNKYKSKFTVKNGINIEYDLNMMSGIFPLVFLGLS